MYSNSLGIVSCGLHSHGDYLYRVEHLRGLAIVVFIVACSSDDTRIFPSIILVSLGLFVAYPLRTDYGHRSLILSKDSFNHFDEMLSYFTEPRVAETDQQRQLSEMSKYSGIQTKVFVGSRCLKVTHMLHMPMFSAIRSMNCEVRETKSFVKQVRKTKGAGW